MPLVSKSEFGRQHGVSHTSVNKWEKAGWLVLQGSKVDVDASNAKLAKYRDSGDARATRGKDQVSISDETETKVETKFETKVSSEVSSQVSESDRQKQPETPSKPARKAAPVAVEAATILPGETAEEAAERLMTGVDVAVDMPIEEARRIKEVYLALLNRLTYEEKSGKVIDLDLARTVLFECARSARDAWLNWPTQVAPEIAADLGIEADKMTDILTEHVHRHIASLGEPEGDFTAS